MDRVNRDRNRSPNPLTAENALAAYDIVSRNRLFVSSSKLPNPLPVCIHPLAIGAENLPAFYEIPWNQLHPSSLDPLNPLAAGSAPVRAPSLGSQQADPPAMKYPDNVLAYANRQKSDRAPTQADPLEDRRDLGAALQPSTRPPYPAARTQPPQQFPNEPATYAALFARYLQDKAQLSGVVAPVLQPTRRHAEAVIDLIEEGISVRVEAENVTAVVRIRRHKPTGVPDNEPGVPSGSEPTTSEPSCADTPHAVSPTEETGSAAKPPRGLAGGRPVDAAPPVSAVDDNKPAPVPELEAELDAASAAADTPERADLTKPAIPPLPPGRKSATPMRRNNSKQQKLEEAFAALAARKVNIETPQSVKTLHGLAVKEAGLKETEVHERTIARARAAALNGKR